MEEDDGSFFDDATDNTPANRSDDDDEKEDLQQQQVPVAAAAAPAAAEDSATTEYAGDGDGMYTHMPETAYYYQHQHHPPQQQQQQQQQRQQQPPPPPPQQQHYTFSRAEGLHALKCLTTSKVLFTYCPQNSIVLDMCCGTGFNIRRVENDKARYVVMADPSREALSTAIGVYNMSNKSFPATPVQVDCFAQSRDVFAGLLDPCISFDFVLCTSAVQQSFSTQENAVAFLRNATVRLRPGCCIMLIFPDAAAIRRLGPDFRNSVCAVSYNPAETRGFGARCTLAVADKNGVPDLRPDGYFVDKEVLRDLAERMCNLCLCADIKLEENLKEFWKNYAVKASEDEIKVMSLFSVLVFRKAYPETMHHDQF